MDAGGLQHDTHLHKNMLVVGPRTSSRGIKCLKFASAMFEHVSALVAAIVFLPRHGASTPAQQDPRLYIAPSE